MEKKMNTVFTSDWETTTSNNGSPFDLKNKAVCLAYKIDNQASACTTFINHPSIHTYINNAKLLVFFNAKFDLHWYTRCGFDVESKPIWCCQLAEFFLSRQSIPYPSLDQTSLAYGLGQKLDIVKTEYWEKGIDTDLIPVDILSKYACQDVDLTYQVYLKQVEAFKKLPAMYKLFRLACQDLMFLKEMEKNGIPYNVELCNQRALEVNDQIKTILQSLCAIYPDITINFNSGDQLSAFLYGGNIFRERKEHIGFYKTGEKAGQPKYKNEIETLVLPRLISPLKGSELQKEGYYKTDADTLRKLTGKAAGKFVQPLLELSRLEKLRSTYYEGLPKKALEYGWEQGILHGQFNQCVASTGRLSSSKPNQQNWAEDCLDLFTSRYD